MNPPRGADVQTTFNVRPSKLALVCSAGFLATIPMVFLAHFFRGVELPAPDFGLLYGGIIGGEVPGVVASAFSSWWWTGYGVHFFATVLLLPILFEGLRMVKWGLHSEMLKGLFFGIAVGILFEATVKPAAGLGFFSARMDQSFVSFSLSLICWAVYGTVLGVLDWERLINRRAILVRK